jgi:uncharacterized protein (DUF58 family)
MAESPVAEVLRQVRRIELRTNRLVSALAAGRYRSAFRGQGVEFDHVREYVAGDDMRIIDWNVTARAGRPWVKVFREERELTLLLVVDISASMRFGAIPGISPRAKLALAAEAAAVVAVLAMRGNDRVGLLLMSDRTELHLREDRGRGHALRVVREVLGAGAGDPLPRPFALSAALDELARVARRRAVVFVISDFIAAGEDARASAALARLSRRHDVVGLRIADPAEESLPASGVPLAIADPEGAGEAVLRASAANARAYRAAWDADRARGRALLGAAGCDCVELSTADGALLPLTRFFRDRARRIRA